VQWMRGGHTQKTDNVLTNLLRFLPDLITTALIATNLRPPLVRMSKFLTVGQGWQMQLPRRNMAREKKRYTVSERPVL
jgi:hypothetical protein